MYMHHTLMRLKRIDFARKKLVVKNIVEIMSFRLKNSLTLNFWWLEQEIMSANLMCVSVSLFDIVSLLECY